MSREELAAQTGLSPRTLEGWLQGRTAKIPASWIAAAIPVLRVNPLWLLRAEGPPELLPAPEAVRRLHVIGLVQTGQYGDAVVALLDINRTNPGSPAEISDETWERILQVLGRRPPQTDRGAGSSA